MSEFVQYFLLFLVWPGRILSFLLPWFCIYMLASLFSCTTVFCYSNKTTVAGKTDFLHFFSFFFPCIDFTLHESDEGEIQRKLESINHIMSQEWNYQPPNQELGAPRSRMYPSHCKFLYFICLSLFTNVCPETTSDKSVIYVKHKSKQNPCHQQKKITVSENNQINIFSNNEKSLIF